MLQHISVSLLSSLSLLILLSLLLLLLPHSIYVKFLYSLTEFLFDRKLVLFLSPNFIFCKIGLFAFCGFSFLFHFAEQLRVETIEIQLSLMDEATRYNFAL